MTIAALVLSIIALVVAALSAWFTRRQAVATEGTRKIEADRRHEELHPVLTSEYVAAVGTLDGQRPGIKLTNGGPLDLDRVEISVVPPHRANEAAIKGIYDPGTGDTAPVHETGVMRRGESWTFAVVPTTDAVDGGPDLDRGGAAKFRCTCYATAHEPWLTIVSADLPGHLWSDGPDCFRVKE